MSRRLTPLLALSALALAACPAPTATTLAAKQQKVDQLTGALSYQNNAHLKDAADSVGEVSTSLSAPGFKRAGGAVGNIVAQGGGNIVAQGGGNIISTNGGGIISTNGGGIISTNAGGLQALGQAVARLGLPLPQLKASRLRLAQASDVQVAADPATGELQRVWNASASLGFKYTKNGNRHQEAITLGGMPDGTSGSFSLDLTSNGWQSTALPAEDSFDGYYGGGQDAGDGYQDPYSTPVYPSGYPSYPSYPSYPYFKVAQAGGITFMGNEAPTDPQAIAIALKLLPKGAVANALHVELSMDEVKRLAAGGAPTASHLTFGFGIPTIDVDGELRLTADGVGSLKGKLALESKPGVTESFTYVLAMDNPNGKASFQLDHPASQVRLRVATVNNPRTGESSADMGLYAMEDNSKIAELLPTEGQPGVITLKYIDGTVKRWAPLSGAPATLVSGPTAASPRPGATATPQPQATAAPNVPTRF